MIQVRVVMRGKADLELFLNTDWKMNVFFETEHLVVRELAAEDDPYGNGMLVYKLVAQ